MTAASTTPLVTGTVLFGVLLAVGLCFAPKLLPSTKPERLSVYEHLCFKYTIVVICVFCMWLQWAAAYMHQMNPILAPIPEAD